MPNMTPEEARTLLDRLKHAGNVDDPVYVEAADAIIPMLETIVGMTWEYGEQHSVIPGRWKAPTWGVNPDNVRQLPGYGEHIRLVRHLVSQPEVMEP